MGASKQQKNNLRGGAGRKDISKCCGIGYLGGNSLAENTNCSGIKIWLAGMRYLSTLVPGIRVLGEVPRYSSDRSSYDWTTS